MYVRRLRYTTCQHVFRLLFHDLQFKLHYSETKNLAVGDVVNSRPSPPGATSWRVNCYPRGSGTEGGGNVDQHLSIFLELMSKSEGVKVIFIAFLMERDGEPCLTVKRMRARLFRSSTTGPNHNWGWPQFVRRGDLEPFYVADGWVTIVCGIVVFPEDDPLHVPSSDMGSHLGALLDCAEGSEVSFLVDGRTYAVLTARSPVLKAELFGFAAEATMWRISLDGIEPAVFQLLLRFIYTDTLPGDDELEDSTIEVHQLLLAEADRYAMERLKLLCTKNLWDNVSVDTVASALACAETYDFPALKSKCIAFFVRLVQKHPSIISDMREKVET